MKNVRILLLLVVAAVIAVSTGLWADANSLPDRDLASEEATIEYDSDFDKMMAVLTHKRCVNCHPSDDYPRQGEDSHVHRFGVQRGDDNHGVAALRCESCHQHDNNNYSGVPGAPEWSLAPPSMAWQGLSRVEIAQSMLNPENNGGRNLEEIVKHLTEHELVLWAWEPGIDADGNEREKPPVPKDEYIAAVKSWAANGAIIPEQ